MCRCVKFWKNSCSDAQIVNILKYLFPVPREDSHRIMTFANNEDFISYRHHVYKRDGADIVLTEVGPRFEMRCALHVL